MAFSMVLSKTGASPNHKDISERILEWLNLTFPSTNQSICIENTSLFFQNIVNNPLGPHY